MKTPFLLLLLEDEDDDKVRLYSVAIYVISSALKISANGMFTLIQLIN
jgi:hypothetical protein